MPCLQRLGTDMQRRQFMTFLGGSAAAWPLMARAQISSRRPLIGILSGVARKVNSPIVAFERGMQELGFVVNVATGVIIDREELEKTCQALSIASIPAEVRTPDDLDGAFQALVRERVEAIIVLVDGMAFQERNRIAALVAAARLPAI